MKTWKRTSGLAAGVGMLGLALLGTATPAHAYGTLDVKFARVDTGDCSLDGGTLPVVNELPGGCRLNDAVDDTYFQRDHYGIGVKVELRDSGSLVSKVEFHPYDKKLWIYDTKNDGDTVYVQLHTESMGWSAIYYAVGSNDVIDKHVIPFPNIKEDEKVTVRIMDESDGSRYITSFAGKA